MYASQIIYGTPKNPFHEHPEAILEIKFYLETSDSHLVINAIASAISWLHTWVLNQLEARLEPIIGGIDASLIGEFPDLSGFSEFDAIVDNPGNALSILETASSAFISLIITGGKIASYAALLLGAMLFVSPFLATGVVSVAEVEQTTEDEFTRKVKLTEKITHAIEAIGVALQGIWIAFIPKVGPIFAIIVEGIAILLLVWAILDP
jgi:hypothetical protein